jgi:hypothetical protein
VVAARNNVAVVAVLNNTGVNSHNYKQGGHKNKVNKRRKRASSRHSKSPQINTFSFFN